MDGFGDSNPFAWIIAIPPYLDPHLDGDLLAALLGHREALLVVAVPLAHLLVDGPAVLLVNPGARFDLVQNS